MACGPDERHVEARARGRRRSPPRRPPAARGRRPGRRRRRAGARARRGGSDFVHLHHRLALVVAALRADAVGQLGLVAVRAQARGPGPSGGRGRGGWRCGPSSDGAWDSASSDSLSSAAAGVSNQLADGSGASRAASRSARRAPPARAGRTRSALRFAPHVGQRPWQSSRHSALHGHARGRTARGPSRPRSRRSLVVVGDHHRRGRTAATSASSSSGLASVWCGR